MRDNTKGIITKSLLLPEPPSMLLLRLIHIAILLVSGSLQFAVEAELAVVEPFPIPVLVLCSCAVAGEMPRRGTPAVALGFSTPARCARFKGPQLARRDSSP